jgi:hypothetical protein
MADNTKPEGTAHKDGPLCRLLPDYVKTYRPTTDNPPGGLSGPLPGCVGTFLQLPVQSGKNEFGSYVLTECPPLRMRRIRL